MIAKSADELLEEFKGIYNEFVGDPDKCSIKTVVEALAYLLPDDKEERQSMILKLFDQHTVDNNL